MAVQDFECQIAKAQIGRYLQGDMLSAEALDQLEAHISECTSCKEALTERRKALQAMLGVKEEAPRAAIVQEPAPRPAGQSIRNKAVAQFQQAIKPKETKSPPWKPLLLSAALAIVLIAMSYLTRGSGSVLGAKVSEALPPAQEAPAEVAPKPTVGDEAGLSPAVTVTPTETITDAEPTTVDAPQKETLTTELEPANAPAKPVVEPEPKVEVKRTSANKTTTRKTSVAKPKEQRAPRRSTIRVYDENGKPLN